MVSGGLNWVWITSSPGGGFSLGAITGIGAFFIGGFGMSRASSLLRPASGELSRQEISQSPTLANRVESLKKSLRWYENMNFLLLAAAMLLMSTARYWNFLTQRKDL
jgi:multisubunit Na+/H+ antiporter MnhB subunit